MATKSVLVIEDSSVVNDLVRDLLEAAGFSVTQSPTSKAGLALVRETPFDVVIAAVDMPTINGYQVLARVRELPDRASIPVLLMTSKGRHHEKPPVPIGPPTDYIDKPIDPVDLIVRTRRAVGEKSQEDAPSGGSSKLGAALAAPSNGSEPKTPRVVMSNSVTPGKIITVFSLKGGVGKSTIAVNLAVAFRQLWEESIALLDLSLEVGALNVLLDIVPTATIDELVSKDGQITAETVASHLIAHKSGVSLLSAPQSPERAELVAGLPLRRVVEVLREAFDYVVIDTASTFAEASLVALEMADNIVLPLVGDISSIRAATTALDIFQALSIPEDRVVPVFNEIMPRIGLTRKHVESSLKMPLVPLPYGGAKVVDSVNLGTPFVMSEPEAAISTSLQNLALELSRAESKARDGAGGKDRSKSPEILSKVRKRIRA